MGYQPMIGGLEKYLLESQRRIFDGWEQNRFEIRIYYQRDLNGL